MLRAEKAVTGFAWWVNWVSGAAIMAMMLLTTLDVVLRLLRSPIPGTYEIVGLLGSVAVSFSLGYTSVEKGHIIVEYVVRRFSPQVQALIGAANALVGCFVFVLVCWQCVAYALTMRATGEVSLTIGMPIAPFILGVAAGSALLCVVLVAECLHCMRTYADLRSS
jgi:TRAP-type C4-dicarboxylate transport system permease small subunit